MQPLSKLFGKAGAVRGAGLDLNDSGLCWVELRKDKAQGLVLERCLFEPLAPGCIAQGQILEFAEVEAALLRLLAGADTGLRPRVPPPLALAVPAALVTTYPVSLPAKLTEAALAERLHVEMASHMRLSDDALCVDFVARPAHRLDAADKQVNANQTHLLAAAVPQEALEDRLALMEGAGLPWRVDVMAVASQAAVSAVCRAMDAKVGRPSAVTGLVQVAADWLQLDILQMAQVLSSARFMLEKSSSTAPEPALELPSGLLKALEAADGSVTAARPVQLWLTGPTDLTAAWAASLQERTGLPCALVNPFESMVLGETVNRLSRIDTAQAAVACGLALMALGDTNPAKRAPQPSFNFMPHRKTALLQRQKRFVQQLGAVALGVLLTSAVARVALSEQMETQQDAQAEVRRDIAALEAELKRLAGTAAEAEQSQRHQDVLALFAQARQQAPMMWRELSTLLPDGLHLTSLRRDAEGAAMVSGQARSAAEVFALIERLSASSQHFKRPELVELTLVAEAGALHTGMPAVAPEVAIAAGPQQASPTLPAMPAPSSVAPGAAPASSQAAWVERVVFTLRAQQP